MKAEQNTPQSLGWLVLGLVLGLLFVLVSVLTPSWKTTSDPGVVAIINNTPITREKYQAFLQVLSEDKKNPIKPADSKFILQRIIEEELLVQRGVEVGLLESNKRSRAALVNAMINMTTTAAEAKAPDKEELTAFFQKNIDYFTAAPRLHVRQVFVTGNNSTQTANLVYQRLIAGDDFYVVNRELGSHLALSVPDTLLPPAKLREYLGPTLTQMLSEHRTGFISEPLATDGGYRILLLVAYEAGVVPEMTAVREQLEVEFARQTGDRALREYLDWLRQRADISYPSGLTL